MKKHILLLIFLLNLLPAVKDGCIEVGLTVSAQRMGNEGGDYYRCEDPSIGEYISAYPCDREVCIMPCPHCDASFPCDEWGLHDCSIYEEDEEDDDNGWHGPWTGTGGGGGSSSGGGGSTGGSTSNHWLQTGKAAWNKMSDDVKNHNSVTYKATISSNNAVITDVSNLITAAGVVDYVTQQLTELGSNSRYMEFSQKLSCLGLAVGGSQTVVLILDKGFDGLTEGDWCTVVSTISTGLSIYLGPTPWGLGLGAFGMAVGVMGAMLYNEIDVKLKDGRIVHIELLEA